MGHDPSGVRGRRDRALVVQTGEREVGIVVPTVRRGGSEVDAHVQQIASTDRAWNPISTSFTEIF